ncbi:MAG: hypothetical protein NC918_06040 [Candidatus Omnitrophica bacterium]|nr:hypothetical protein [Candidatus Omnitrophota bacterium]
MKKAQASLESTVAFLAAALLFAAATAVFSWGISHIPARQLTYEATRVLAGTPRMRNVDERGAKGGAYSIPVWPTYCAGGGSCGYSP